MLSYGAVWFMVIILFKLFYKVIDMFVLIYLQKNGETPESMTSKDAAMFPIIASCTLLGLYIFFKVSVHTFKYTKGP